MTSVTYHAGTLMSTLRGEEITVGAITFLQVALVILGLTATVIVAVTLRN
jgi:hypothetical protein